MSAAPGTPEHPVVVFDCDNTLIAGDALAGFIVDLLGHGPRLLVAVAAAPAFGPMLVAHRSRRAAISGWLWIATAARSDTEIGQRIAAYVDCHLSEVGAVLTAGLSRVREHLDRGDRVVIATAAAEPLAGCLLTRVGLADLPVVASPVRRVRGGWTLTAHCWGPFKPALLAAGGIPGPYQAAYSDSFVDLPLLRLAAEPVLVNPGRWVARRLRRKLPHLRTVSWDRH